MLEINKIYHGDCLQLMPELADHSVDMVLCDLPYGTTAPDWDKHINITELWIQYKRIITKRGSIVLFAAQPFTTKLISSNETDFKYCWYWLKNQGTNFFHARRMPIRKIEEICIFRGSVYHPQITDGHVPTNSAKGCSNGSAYFGSNTRNYTGGKTTRYPTNILEFKCVGNYARLHSAQKPVELCEYLIQTYTDPGMLVLDNCIGSGTTAIACMNTGRSFIGMEMDQKYYDVTVERIRTHVSTV